MDQRSTIGRLLETSRGYDQLKVDYSGRKYGFRFTPEMQMQMIEGQTVIGDFKVSDNALHQLCAKFGATLFGVGSGRSLPYDAFRAYSDDERYAALAAPLLNRHLSEYRGELFIRTYDSTVRAALSEQYAVVPNTDLLQAVAAGVEAYAEKRQATIDGLNIKSLRSEVTPDRIDLKAIIHNVHPDENGKAKYGVGFYVGNDEIGQGRLHVCTLIQVHACANSIIISQAGDEGYLAKIHRGVGRMLTNQATLVIAHALSLGKTWLAQFLEAQEIAIPKFNEVITDVGKQLHWSADVMDAVRDGAGGEQTMGGLINGVTYAAHNQFEAIPEQISFELLGGAILADPHSLFGRAAWVNEYQQRVAALHVNSQ